LTNCEYEWRPITTLNISEISCRPASRLGRRLAECGLRGCRQALPEPAVADVVLVALVPHHVKMLFGDLRRRLMDRKIEAGGEFFGEAARQNAEQIGFAGDGSDRPQRVRHIGHPSHGRRP